MKNPHKEAYYEEGGILGFSQEKVVSWTSHKKIVKERNKLLEENKKLKEEISEYKKRDEASCSPFKKAWDSARNGRNE